jgi:hypothetical protein
MPLEMRRGLPMGFHTACGLQVRGGDVCVQGEGGMSSDICIEVRDWGLAMGGMKGRGQVESCAARHKRVRRVCAVVL